MAETIRVIEVNMKTIGDDIMCRIFHSSHVVVRLTKNVFLFTLLIEI